MQTDLVSAAHAYRLALEAISETKAHAAAMHVARKALEITIPEAQESHITVTSGYGRNTQRPYVTIALTTPVVQLEASQARKLAIQIIEAAEAARSDGFFIRFVREELKEGDHVAAMMLPRFRQYREQGQTEA